MIKTTRFRRAPPLPHTMPPRLTHRHHSLTRAIFSYSAAGGWPDRFQAWPHSSQASGVILITSVISPLEGQKDVQRTAPCPAVFFSPPYLLMVPAHSPSFGLEISLPSIPYLPGPAESHRALSVSQVGAAGLLRTPLLWPGLAR